MIYPKILHELDNRRVFTLEDLMDIKLLYSQGHKIGTIAKLYGKPHSTIKYILDPDYNLERRLQARKANAQKRLDPEFAKEEKRKNNLYHKRKRQIMPEEKLYDKDQMIEFKRKHPGYFKEWHKKHKSTK